MKDTEIKDKWLKKAKDTQSKVRNKLYRTITPSHYPSRQVFKTIKNLAFNKERMTSGSELEELLKEIEELKPAREKYEEEYTKAWNSTIGKKRLDAIDQVAEKHRVFLDKDINAKERLRNISGNYYLHDEDMWRFYLDIPQVNNSIIKSEYKPTKSTDPNSKYYTISDEAYDSESLTNWKESIEGLAKRHEKEGGKFPLQTHSGISGLSNITIDKGSDKKGDYYSIYDKYDFNIPGQKLIGKPYEIYDRIYLDKPSNTTQAPINNINEDYRIGLQKYQEGGKVKDPPLYSDRVKTVRTETGAYPDPNRIAKEAKRDKVGNYFKDAATNLITVGTQLRYPTKREIEAGRSGIAGQASMVGQGVGAAMLDAMTGKALSKVGSIAGKKVKNIKNARSVALDAKISKMEKLYKLEYQADRFGKQDMSTLLADDFVKDWFNDPITKGKVKDPDLYSRMIKNTEGLKTKVVPKEYSPYGKSTHGVNFSSVFNPKKQNTMVFDITNDPVIRKSVGVHEGTHAVTAGNRLLPKEQIDLINKKTKGFVNDLVAKPGNTVFGNTKKYISNPTEVHARIMQMREINNMKPGDVFTEEHYNNAIKSFSGRGEYSFSSLKDMSKVFKKGKKDVVQLANTLPVATGVTLGLNNNMKRQEKSVGGIIGSTAGMAATGTALLPGIGTVIGAGVGLITGLVGHSKEKKAERQAEQVELDAVNQEKALNIGGSYNPYTATFAQGGETGMVPVELEKEEVFQTPDGQMGQVDGPSHSQGGIDMDLPEDTVVWSDMLKASSGKTYAEEAEKIMKKMKKYEKHVS